MHLCVRRTAAKDGTWCLKLAPGTYQLKATTPAAQAVANPERTLVVEGPQTGVAFHMARVHIRGKVNCVAGTACDPQVTLHTPQGKTVVASVHGTRRTPR